MTIEIALPRTGQSDKRSRALLQQALLTGTPIIALRGMQLAGVA